MGLKSRFFITCSCASPLRGHTSYVQNAPGILVRPLSGLILFILCTKMTNLKNSLSVTANLCLLKIRLQIVIQIQLVSCFNRMLFDY